MQPIYSVRLQFRHWGREPTPWAGARGANPGKMKAEWQMAWRHENLVEADASPEDSPAPGASAARATKSSGVSRSAWSSIQNEDAHGGTRTMSSGVSKLSSRCRILISALARAAGAISNNSREKVTKGICV